MMSTPDQNPKLPRRNVTVTRATPSPATPIAPSLEDSPEDREWSSRRQNSTLSLRQLAMAATPKRNSKDRLGGSDPTTRQGRRNPDFANTRSRSVACVRGAQGGSSMLSPMRDLSERKVIRSPNSSYSLSRRIPNQVIPVRIPNQVIQENTQANFVWSMPAQKVETKPRANLLTAHLLKQEARIPDSIQIVNEVSASQQHIGTNDTGADGSDTSSLAGSEEDLVVSLRPSASQSRSPRVASLSPASVNRSPRRKPRMMRKLSSGTDQCKPGMHDSRRTVSTAVSTGSASEYSALQSSAAQAPMTWACLCGECNDQDFNFCGMCARPATWVCTECYFERNKCRQIYCGKCGSQRALATTMPAQNQATAMTVQNQAA